MSYNLVDYPLFLSISIIILQNNTVIFICREHVKCRETVCNVSHNCNVSLLNASKGDNFDTAYLPCVIGILIVCLLLKLYNFDF